ncbi:MAG: DNA polymerase III subunit delta [Gammaproteobacteria bacterium]|nr:DNA polymerase III subunit delta [Gammaproteobacteria bacterium]
MELRSVTDLQRGLRGELRPIYLISGDEPLQLMEAEDAVRRAAREWGAIDREILEVDRSFDWHQLDQAASNLSLFAERRLLELRIPTGKPGKEGGEALTRYAERPAEDTVLLVTAGRLDQASLKTRWYQAVTQIGASLRVWPVEAPQLPRWISERLASKGLQPRPGVSELLAERVEGNLLAAAQEIDKLLILNGPGMLDLDSVLASVSDQSRFDVFGLVDAALAGDVIRSTHMLASVRAEGIAQPVVLWALVGAIRTLAQMAFQIAAGDSVDDQLRKQRVWEKRKAAHRAALRRFPAAAWHELVKRAARVDRVVKGARAGDAWEELLHLTLALCGQRPLSTI